MTHTDLRYTYDPFSQSQNDNPESELPLLSGDYVLVWGEIDEDGYLEAELMDGRRGLVPSNYITKLVGEDLMEFHQSMVVGTSGGGAGEVADDGWSTSIPQVRTKIFSQILSNWTTMIWALHLYYHALCKSKVGDLKAIQMHSIQDWKVVYRNEGDLTLN